MANFLDQLTKSALQKRDELQATLHVSQRELDARLQELVRAQWHPLPDRALGVKQPGFAVDGSSRRADLVNGSVVLVAQSLIVGEGISDDNLRADIEMLPGTVPEKKLDRFADVMRQWLEISLACEFAAKIPEGSVLYLDGAIYGTFPQLYPLAGDGISEDKDFARKLLEEYRALFALCESRNILLVSIAKTNRQALFSTVLQKRAGVDPIHEISDSALFDELTNQSAGYATPLLLGTYSFGQGSDQVVLERGNAREFPAIISFFVRLNDYDDALRVDVPACCVGRTERLGDLNHELIDHTVVENVVRILLGDYGGLQVYNALAYVTDHEVRLTKHKMYDIYLPILAAELHEELRIDRSQRRFVE